MPNSYYNHATYPAPNAPGSSAALRAELDFVTAGFNKLPTLAGNANKLVSVNAAGDALVAGGSIANMDFTTTGVADAVGRLTWNDTDGTLNLGMKGGNVVLQIGQEQLLRGYNNSGSAMTELQVVYISGSSGQRPVIALAQANSETTSSKTIGVLTENIANNSEGFVNVNGLVNNVNTSALTEGAVLWLSPTVPGGLTTTRPAAPLNAVVIGYCIRSHATLGKIFVNVQNGYELEELHDVLISGVANNNMLRYNSSLSVWQNIAGPAGAVVGTTDTQTLTNKTFSGGTVTGAVVTGLATPTADSDAANKAYVDGVAQGLDIKGSARVATTANVTLSGTQTIDGVSLSVGDRVLVKDQSAPAENGIYVVASGSWTRSADMNVWTEVPGAFAFVEQGAVNDNSGWVCTSPQGGTLGSTAITFEQFSGAGQITAGAGMTKTGNTLNVGTASSARIVVNADDIDLAATGVTADTYKSVTVDIYGRVTAGTNPTTLAGFGITDAYTKIYIDTLYGSTASAAASAADALTYKNAAESAAATATTQAGIATTAAGIATTAAGTATTQAGIATLAADSAAASWDQFDDRYLGAKSSPPTVDNDGNALVVGALYFDTTSNLMKVYTTNSTWANAGSSVNGTANRATYTATAGQTTFAIVYDVGYVDVYLNGVKQQVGVDFVATSGVDVVFAVGLTVGDIVDIVAYGAFTLANVLPLTGGTMSGLITFAAGQTFPGAGVSYTRYTANVTATNMQGIIADTTGGAFTVTLPASPVAGNMVSIVDGGDWGTNNLTVARNGATIEGLAEDLVLNISSVAVDLIYSGTTWQVYAQVGGTSGDVVTVNGTQTLTNKTIAFADNTLTGVVGLIATQTLTNKTITNIVLDGSITEDVYNLTGTALDPANGTVQTKTLSANTTFTDSLATGQSMILGIDDGTAYTVTWPTITWTTNPVAAPTLPTSGYLWVVLWKVGTTLYGKY